MEANSRAEQSSSQCQNNMKLSKQALFVPFSLIGAGYFILFSNLAMHPLLEMQLFALPIQGGLLFYFLIWLPRRQRGQGYRHDRKVSPTE